MAEWLIESGLFFSLCDNNGIFICFEALDTHGLIVDSENSLL